MSTVLLRDQGVSAPTHREIVEKMPLALARRPRNAQGYPVPWFTPWHDGKWDFRFVEPGKAEQAVRESRCWVCGEQLTSWPVAFVIGPMCAVNHTSAEPPSHIACAIYSAKACPFLARPKMVRPTIRQGIEGAQEAMPGVMLDRNPGVALVWITSSPSFDPRSKLFDIGEPERTRWFAHSREATREEVIESIESGLPILRGMAEQDGPDAIAELDRRTDQALALVPA